MGLWVWRSEIMHQGSMVKFMHIRFSYGIDPHTVSIHIERFLSEFILFILSSIC